MSFLPKHEHTHRFPSSLWMAFPGLQCTQEIGSVIVYVSVENATKVFLAVVSWPILHSFASRKAEQRCSL